jgi:hypothetical protein
MEGSLESRVGQISIPGAYHSFVFLNNLRR